MILRKIEIEKYGNDIGFSYQLKKKAKHITNYINRTCLHKLKFSSDDFNTIVISLETSKQEVRIINAGLIIPVSFERKIVEKYETEKEFRTFFLSSIANGLEQIKNKYIVPELEILESMEQLEKNNYLNEWNHKRKTDKQRKIEVELNCKLTIEKFELKLKIVIDREIICNQTILETDPDEVAYEYKFKDIIINDDIITVTNKISGKLLDYSIETRELKIFK